MSIGTKPSPGESRPTPSPKPLKSYWRGLSVIDFRSIYSPQNNQGKNSIDQ